MSAPNPKVDFFFTKAVQWKAEYEKLRAILLSTELTEELKWGCPCYTLHKKNVVLIHGFNEYCALLFMKGALLPDPDGILIQQTENVQAARQIRFRDLREILTREGSVMACIFEAIQAEKEGKAVEMKKHTERAVPAEFQSRLDADADLKSAFEALTPGRQTAYLFYFSSAKQAKTRETRVEKYIPKIRDGKGLED